MLRSSVQIGLVSMILLAQSAIAQPAGQNIVITPSSAGTRVWDAGAAAWLVTLDPALDVGEQLLITIDGVPATGSGALPGITNIDVMANANGTQLVLTITNIHHIDRINKRSVSSPSVVIASANLSSFLGQPGKGPALDVDTIVELIVGGGVQNDIVATDWIGAISIGANLYGDITTNGDLVSLKIARRLGKATDFSKVNVGGSISFLEAAEIHADITVGATGGGGDGRVSTIKSIAGGNFTGEFEGSLSAVDLRELGPAGDRSYIFTAGDLDADITFTQEVADDNNGSAVIKVDGNFNGTLTIGEDLFGDLDIATTSLVGQIIINAGNNAKQWLGDAVIGTITIGPNESQPDDAPYYDRASADIGGGAIGLVPFSLHGADSSPADGDVVLNAHYLTQARIRHYGPITIDQTGGLAVKIERRTSYYPGNNTSSWSDVSNLWTTSDVTVSERDLLIAGASGQFDCGYEYRITPIASRVECDLTSPVDVDSWIYQFEIPYCPLP